MKAIDSSTVAKYLNAEDNWEEAREVLSEGCVSLDLAVIETGNAVWKLARRKEIDTKTAKRRFSEFVASLPFRTVDQAAFYDAAFEISLRTGLSFYDALFVALAKEESLELVTSDRGQAEAARTVGVEARLIE